MSEEYGRKKYVDSEKIDHVRDTYRARFGLMPFAGNFKNDKQFARALWKCNHCQKMDSESHLLWCDAYKELRQNKNLSNDKDLCKYLQDIL